MKNSLSQASALLELTRDAYDPPDAAARERVRQRIAAALVGTVVGSSASAAQAASANKLHTLAQSKSVSSVNLFAKLALVTSMTMMGGAAWLVLPHGVPSGRTQVTWVRMTEAPEVRAPALPVMRVEPLPERIEAEQRSSTASPTSAPDIEATAMQAEASPPRAVKERSHAPRARRSASSMSEEESLAAEVSLLHHAERALASGEAELALSMLQTHREQFPRALLREEQAGLVALARCTVDADDTRPARSFLARHPDSMLNARIRQACPLAAQ